MPVADSTSASQRNLTAAATKSKLSILWRKTEREGIQLKSYYSQYCLDLWFWRSCRDITGKVGAESQQHLSTVSAVGT